MLDNLRRGLIWRRVAVIVLVWQVLLRLVAKPLVGDEDEWLVEAGMAFAVLLAIRFFAGRGARFAIPPSRPRP